MYAVDIDAKEMMDVAKVTHGKLRVEPANDIMEDSVCFGGENVVIHI